MIQVYTENLLACLNAHVGLSSLWTKFLDLTKILEAHQDLSRNYGFHSYTVPQAPDFRQLGDITNAYLGVKFYLYPPGSHEDRCSASILVRYAGFPFSVGDEGESKEETLRWILRLFEMLDEESLRQIHEAPWSATRRAWIFIYPQGPEATRWIWDRIHAEMEDEEGRQKDWDAKAQARRILNWLDAALGRSSDPAKSCEFLQARFLLSCWLFLAEGRHRLPIRLWSARLSELYLMDWKSLPEEFKQNYWGSIGISSPHWEDQPWILPIRFHLKGEEVPRNSLSHTLDTPLGTVYFSSWAIYRPLLSFYFYSRSKTY